MEKVLEVIFRLLPFLNTWFNNPIKKKARLVRKLNRWEKKGKITKTEKLELLKEIGIKITPTIQSAARKLKLSDQKSKNYS